MHREGCREGLAACLEIDGGSGEVRRCLVGVGSARVARQDSGEGFSVGVLVVAYVELPTVG